MSILANYYKLLTEIVIANNEKVTIDPDTPYTMVYLLNDKDCSQCTGIIRGIIGEDDTIAVISLNAENMNYASVINTRSIVRISPYSFNAHFEDSFNNWIGVEVSEKSRIDIRLRYVNSEAIVPVEQGSLYKITYVTKKDGENTITTGIGKITNIIRSTTKEGMPEHINHFTNDIDYILIVDFGDKNSSNTEAINVIDIRQISIVVEEFNVDISKLQSLIIDTTTRYLALSDLYTEASMKVLKDLIHKANYDIVANAITTNVVLDKYIKDINKAIDNLKEVKDEYDLVRYDETTNTLHCEESGYQVVIEKEEGCNSNTIKYFTNFGTEKSIKAPDKLNVIWGRTCNTIEREVEGFIGYIKEPFNIIFNNASLKDVYLGYKIEKFGDDGTKYNNIVAKFKDCDIETLYAGGKHGYTSDYNKAIVIGGHIDTIYNGGDNSDNVPDHTNIESRIQLVNTTVDNAYLGGISEHTKAANMDIRESIISNLVCSGTKDSVCSNNHVTITGGSVDDMAYMAEGSISTTVAILNSVKIKNVTIGGKDINSGTFNPGEADDPNLMYLLINLDTDIETLQLGYANGEKVHKEYVKVDYPKFNVTNDVDNLIYNS